MSDGTVVYGSGISVENGKRTIEMEVGQLHQLISAESESRSDSEKKFLQVQKEGRKSRTLGPPRHIDPSDLSEARWGIVWPPKPLNDAEKAHQAALAGLIEHRCRQMNGKKPHQFHYRRGWTYDQFLWAEGRQVVPGTMTPDNVPYYLCIVGSPERIPWQFQHYLDGEYAVGRLWFDDAEDCKSYTSHLLKHERGAERVASAKEVLFVGTQHENDRPTQESADQLIKPLHDWLSNNLKLQSDTSLLLGDQTGREAYKKHILKRLKGYNIDDKPKVPPALLFTAGHGLEDKPSANQYAIQGALICQEWPGGPKLQPDQYLAGADVSHELKLTGRMAFCFACYSAGTPLKEDWVPSGFFRKPAKIAQKPFVACLPQKLLAHGMAAFIGHVSRVWDFSFLGARGADSQLQTFQSTISELLRGYPVGHATDYLNERWVHLTNLLDNQVAGKEDKEETIATWKARNDCRGYVIMGDPAASM